MATWTGIGNGQWGVKLDPDDEGVAGAQVTVRKKDGGESTVTLDAPVPGRQGVWTVRRQWANGGGGGGQRQAQPPRVYVSEDAAAAARDALIARLDPDQRSVLSWNPGRNGVVIATAGAGKTTTTVALVADLLRRGVNPNAVVVTTFTNKAGKELEERLLKVLTRTQFDALKVGTFHGLLRRSLVEQDAQRWEMRLCVDANARTRTAQTPPASSLWFRACGSDTIQVLGGIPGVGVGDEVVGEYRLAVESEALSKGFSHDSADAAAAIAATQMPRLHEAWRLYEAQKRAANAWDFSDVLFAGRELLRVQFQSNHRIVIVDEAQDNSTLQIELARLMAGPRGNVIFVGDVRQSIYGWRGAAPDLFKHAERDLNAQPFFLPNNYRSGRKIVELGNRVAEGQDWSVGPPARAARDVDGTVTVTGYGDTDGCASSVAREVAAEVADGTRPDSFAILCRTRAEQGAYEAALLVQRVPVAIVGGSSFFASRVWRDYAALLSCVTGTATGEQVQRALLAVPAVGPRTAEQVVREFNQSHDLVAAIGGVAGDRRTRAKTVEALSSVQALLRNSAPLSYEEKCGAAAEFICAFKPAAESGDNDERGEVTACGEIAARFQNVGEALAFAARCEGAALSLHDDAPDEAGQGRVCISTIHKAKGREWQTVYADVSARRFPHSRCTGEKQLAEERRLFYVTVTRAADNLRLSYCGSIYGKEAGPSQFLRFVEQEGPKGGGREVVPEVVPAVPATPEVPAPEALPVVVTDAGPSPRALSQQLYGIQQRAVELTSAGVQPAPGQRFVPVTFGDFQSLFSGLPVSEDTALTAKTGQRVLSFTVQDGSKVVVYTSIPEGQEEARELGEDSIRFGLLNTEGRPLMKRQPYSARTRNWRSTVVSRLLEVVSRFGGTCEDCGGLTVERQAKESGKVFHSCVKFPDCKGYGSRVSML